MYGILLQHCVLCYGSCVQLTMGIFCMVGMNIFLLVNKIRNILRDKYFQTVFFSGSLLKLLLEHCDFLNTDISQGSVATYLRCGGMFRYEFVANLPLSLPAKEFRKPVNIWGSYGQEFSVL